MAAFLLLACLLLGSGSASAHEIEGGAHFMCQVQPPEEFDRADDGDPGAQYRVGNMLDFCPPEDPAAAARYFLRAARQGEIKSTLRIGRKYMFGIGVVRDDRQAYFWLSVGKRLFGATQNPSPEPGPDLRYVEADLRLLEKSLTPEEIGEIRGRVARWEPTSESTPPGNSPPMPPPAASPPVTPKPPDPAGRICPPGATVNCMPPVPEQARPLCSPEYLQWMKAHCPGVRIVY